MNLIPIFVPNQKISVCETASKGLGVFAMQPISANEIIERVPILVIPSALDSEIIPNKIGDYVFAWSNDDMAIALGYGSFYNHSYSPNAFYDLKYDINIIEFISLTSIEAGSEITVNYNGKSNRDLPLWFKVLE